MKSHHHKWRKFLSILFLLIGLTLIVTAHKDSAESVSTMGNYNILLGLVPANPYAGGNQEVVVKVFNVENDLPVSGLDVLFTFKKKYSFGDISKKSGLEVEPGMYIGSEIFNEKGGHIINIDLSKDGSSITSLEKEIYVEPNGPSLLFWIYMLLALVVSAYIAARGDQLA